MNGTLTFALLFILSLGLVYWLLRQRWKTELYSAVAEEKSRSRAETLAKQREADEKLRLEAGADYQSFLANHPGILDDNPGDGGPAL